MEIAVVGIGNILLSDEGVGVRIIEELQKLECLQKNVKLIDGGTTGLDLVAALTGCQRLIVADAVSGGQEPGSVYVLSSEQVKQYFQTKVSLHEVGIQEVLQVLAILGKPVQEVVIVGIQPAAVELGLELSPIVHGELGRAVGAVCEQLAVWGIQVNLSAEVQTFGDC